MSTILRIAVRNVLRHKRRAIITAITMTVGIALFVAIDSMIAGTDRTAIENMINLSDASVRIYSRAYDANRQTYPLDHGIAAPQRVKALLSGDPRVSGTTDRAQFLAQVSNLRDSTYVVGTVVDPQTDPSVFALKSYLVAGNFFSGTVATGKADRRIVMGKSLAGKLGLKLGDSVVLEAQTRYGAQNADYFQIVGLLSTNDPTIDDNSIYVTYRDANDFLDLGSLVTEIDVGLRGTANLGWMEHTASEVAATVSAAFPNLRPYTFQEQAKAFLDLLRAKSVWTSVIVLIILLIAAVGIVNSVLMSVYERVREVGVLKALGFKGREILWMFTFEGLLIGILGSLLGALFGFLLDWYLVAVGIPIGGSTAASAGLALSGTLNGTWNPGAIVFASLFGILVALLAGLVPARRAARMTATSALRFV